MPNTEKEKEARLAEQARWNEEAAAAFAPAGVHKKGSHDLPSPSGSGTPLVKSVRTISRQPHGTYKSDD